jgi:hypothetical protein
LKKSAGNFFKEAKAASMQERAPSGLSEKSTGKNLLLKSPKVQNILKGRNYFYKVALILIVNQSRDDRFYKN